MFMIIYKKVVEAKNTMAMAAANERVVIARYHRTGIFVERKTSIMNTIKMTRIF
jgi:hypothetical protein